MAAAVVERMKGGYAQSSEPFVTMMDMLLEPPLATSFDSMVIF